MREKKGENKHLNSAEGQKIFAQLEVFFEK